MTSLASLKRELVTINKALTPKTVETYIIEVINNLDNLIVDKVEMNY